MILGCYCSSTSNEQNLLEISFDIKHLYSVVVSAFVFIVVATVPSFAVVVVVVVLNIKNKTEAKPLTFSFHDNRE